MMANRKKKRPTIGRCLGCGGWVVMPCRTCATRTEAGPQQYDGTEEPQDLDLDLAPKDAKRYDKIPAPTPNCETPKQPDSRSVATPSPWRKIYSGRR
jgi:hypothetical protein